MKKLMGRLVLAGALAGAVLAVWSYVRREPAARQTVQIVFDDGSTLALASDTVEARELASIARQVIEVGV